MQAYVFVVCGGSKHIETLHFSLKYLKHFSKLNIYVVTDSIRNEKLISHSNIIDIKTPENLDNHQASIWLKTSLHRLLPEENTYCYLDSDVIAVNQNCDLVFNQFISPISFAKDHCKMNSFSPYAINCSCLNNYFNDKSYFEHSVSKIVNNKNYPPDFHNKNTRMLFGFLDNIKNHPFKNAGTIFKLWLGLFGFELKLKNEFSLSKKTKGFKIIHNNFEFPFLYFYRKEIKEKINFEFKYSGLKWIKPDRTEFAKNTCNHLIENITKKFGIKINNPTWQHWNGGVFVFNKDSHAFMEKWHQLTVSIFQDSDWKIRDQGTLIATVWSEGLQNHPTLSEEFNFIADFYKFDMSVSQNSNKLEILKNNKIIYPNLVHVYHEFGTKGWDLWDCIESLEPKE